MKISLVCFLLAFAASALASDQSTLTGRWRVHTSIAGTESDQTCTFVDNDGNLTGSCMSEEHGSVRITGKVDQMSVSWSYTSDGEEGSSITVRYYGRVDSGRITGSVSMPDSGTQGDFMAMPDNSASPSE